MKKLIIILITLISLLLIGQFIILPLTNRAQTIERAFYEDNN